jgi:hypothetical protein
VSSILLDDFQDVGLIHSSGKPSGGTLNTIFTLLDVYSFKQLGAAGAPYALSPVPGPKTKNPKSWITKLFGVRVVPDLGILTTAFGGSVDKPIVQRSWGLLGGNDFYGPNFSFGEYSKARNHLTAVLMHFGLVAGAIFLTIPVFRKFARKFVYQPGDGPTKEEYKNDRFEYRGIAKPDVQIANPPKAFCRAYFNGSLYACKCSRSFGESMLILGQSREFRWQKLQSPFFAKSINFLEASIHLHVLGSSSLTVCRLLVSSLRRSFMRTEARLHQFVFQQGVRMFILASK